jgi:hypothetical protein
LLRRLLLEDQHAELGRQSDMILGTVLSDQHVALSEAPLPHHQGRDA